MSPNRLSNLLERVDSKVLATYLSQEQAQTIAVMVSCMVPDRQSEVVKVLPVKLQPEVTTRMAQMEFVDPNMLDAICDVVKSTLLDKQ